MAIEQGILVRMGKSPKTAWVKTVRNSACESCSSRDKCHMSTDPDSQEVEAINIAQARIGDRIQLTIGTGSVMKAMLLLYIFPILCLLAGGILGDAMAPGWNFNPSVSAAIFAMIGFVISMIIVRILGQRMGGKEAYRPKIVRILGHDAGVNEENTLSVGCADQVATSKGSAG